MAVEGLLPGKEGRSIEVGSWQMSHNDNDVMTMDDRWPKSQSSGAQMEAPPACHAGAWQAAPWGAEEELLLGGGDRRNHCASSGGNGS